MIIHEMTRENALAVLRECRFGRLACCKASQPYVTPISFALLHDEIVAFSTEGQKIDWMRLNPSVCLEVDEVETPQRWKCVIVLGKYVEVSDLAMKNVIHNTLAKRTCWWEPGYARTVLGGEARALHPVYFKISIGTISGHVAEG